MRGLADQSESRILLLAPPDSFSAVYIRYALTSAGALCLSPAGAALEALTGLQAEEWATISACLAIDLADTDCSALVREASRVPLLFVGPLPSSWHYDPGMWLRPPFASFQVLDRLQSMMDGFTPVMTRPATARPASPVRQ
jgi:hypothetical protein